MSSFYAVIMAGGSGTRFWPLSRSRRPKQFLNLLGPRSMLQQTVDRLEGAFAAERIYVVGAREHTELLKRDLPMLPPENIIEEPVGRDTAACVGLAATVLHWRDPEAVLCCLPADHHIGDTRRFHAALERARVLAEEGSLVAFGVPPTRPETGFGYLEVDGDRVKRFCEKPDAQRAAEFVATGRHLWNCGIFVWRTDVILKEIGTHLPGHAEALKRIGAALGTSRLPLELAKAFEPLPRISIDYGVMERTSGVRVVRADFSWSDVGSWIAAAEHREADDSGNVREGPVVMVDSRGCFVLSEGDHLVATLGIEDLVIVRTPDATLICPKSRAADLKQLTQILREKGFERNL